MQILLNLIREDPETTCNVGQVLKVSYPFNVNRILCRFCLFSAFWYYVQSPEFKFRFVFFRLQMLRFSALGGPNEETFGELLTWPKVITPSKCLPNQSTES